MAVRKKTQTSPETGDKIDLSSHLQAVREAIQQLPPPENEGADMSDPTAAPDAASTPKGAVKKKSTDPKKVTKAAAKPAAASPKKDEMTTLAEICKSLKMEPRRGRRILRNAEGVPETGDRWSWKKGSADVAKVTKILKDADAE